MSRRHDQGARSPHSDTAAADHTNDGPTAAELLSSKVIAAKVVE
jgi:hypothetical protein